MSRVMRAAAWAAVIVLFAISPLWAVSIGARTDRTELVLRDYNTWTGVLRLWKCEGWQSGNGTLTAWLNTCIEKFEKQHKGVYIQITDVSEETMRGFALGTVNPPDMLIYASGMLDAPYDLVQLPYELPVRENVSSLGLWQEERYAAPIALGGYALAVNRSLLEEIPDDWNQVELKESSSKKKEVFAFDAPADSAYRSWSAAVIALFAGSTTRSGGQQVLVGEGLELGLPTRKPQPAEPSQEEQITYPGVLPALLPEEFRKTESVYSRFTAGEIAAMPVTQREIRRLELLDESGKAPDWYVQSIGFPFTDQAALFSVTARQGKDADERRQLSLEFLELLLSDPMQEKLSSVRAFSVGEQAPMYRNNRGLYAIETALNDEGLLLAPAFGWEWRSYAQRLMDDISSGESTQEAYELLESALCEQPQN